MIERRRARDLSLVDAIDVFERQPLDFEVWRVTRQGRDPLEPRRTRGRWSDATFDVLYTAQERDGAIAEIFSLLADQPIFPSKPKWSLHRLHATCAKAMVVSSVGDLAPFQIEAKKYREREYARTQDVADAAFFLGFDALLAPSARWPCQNLVLFTEHLTLDDIVLEATEDAEIDWVAWRRRTKR